MIATVASSGNEALPCVVRWTGKDGWVTVSIITWCADKHDASDVGVTQYPDGIPVCERCKTAINEFRHQVGIR